MDNDEGQNANITYSINHVSVQGHSKFYIDPSTGWIETTGRMMAGDQYSITIQATDSGGLFTQSIVEVIVVAGPNTKSPVFSQSSYEVTVSEGSPINTTVIPLKAIDPENDPVSYSILSGNDLRQFTIGEKSGIVSVIRKLDREELTRYQLVSHIIRVITYLVTYIMLSLFVLICNNSPLLHVDFYHLLIFR